MDALCYFDISLPPFHQLLFFLCGYQASFIPELIAEDGRMSSKNNPEKKCVFPDSSFVAVYRGYLASRPGLFVENHDA